MTGVKSGEGGATDGMVAVDLGCGSARVTLPLARDCLHVLAVDLNEAAIGLLKARAEQQRIRNVHPLTQPIETFGLAPESVDLVVSNYALTICAIRTRRTWCGGASGGCVPAAAL